jgi:hypothetical protein
VNRTLQTIIEKVKRENGHRASILACACAVPSMAAGSSSEKWLGSRENEEEAVTA